MRLAQCTTSASQGCCTLWVSSWPIWQPALLQATWSPALDPEPNLLHKLLDSSFRHQTAHLGSSLSRGPMSFLSR